MSNDQFVQRKQSSIPTLPRLLPIRTEILLSLRSFSSFFPFSLSLRPSSFALFESLFSLSECKLRLELDPFKSDGKPNTEDFLDVVGDVTCASFVGDVVLGGRKWVFDVDEEYVGEVDDGTPGGGSCMDWDDERRKNGIEDGVSRFVDGPLCIENDGLSGVC